jgi:urease accessory protein
MSDAAALAGYRLADSFLPVGSDSVSYGLEQFVAADRVADAADLEALLEGFLTQQVGPADLVALRAAHAGTAAADLDAVAEADRRLTAVTLAAEFRESSERAGQRLLSLQRDLRDDDFLEAYAARLADDAVPGTYPVVLGVVAARDGIEAREACLLYCHGFLTGLLGAAQRLLSFGHADAQRVLDSLRPAVVAAVDDSGGRGIDEMTPFAPLTDVLAAAHERADRRLFLS